MYSLVGHSTCTYASPDSALQTSIESLQTRALLSAPAPCQTERTQQNFPRQGINISFYRAAAMTERTVLSFDPTLSPAGITITIFKCRLQHASFPYTSTNIFNHPPPLIFPYRILRNMRALSKLLSRENYQNYFSYLFIYSYVRGCLEWYCFFFLHKLPKFHESKILNFS